MNAVERVDEYTKLQTETTTAGTCANSISNLCTVNCLYLEVEAHLKLLGPVVQSIVSLTCSFRGQLVKCFTTL